MCAVQHHRPSTEDIGIKLVPTLPPGKDFIFQTNESFSGAYEADPIDVRTLGLVASDGTGISISTLVAVLKFKSTQK